MSELIVMSSVLLITISSDTLNHSNFYNGNSSTAAAIQIYGSTPYISNTHIEGQSGSWSGVRFQNSSGGSITGCTIQNLGSGDGVIIQGGSNPTISNNTISSNHYHGILAIDNGNGVPQILSNQISGSTNNAGIYSDNSMVRARSNTITGNLYGVYSTDYASIQAWIYTGDEGDNQIYNNGYGLYAESHGGVGFGVSQHGANSGRCNGIYNNGVWNAYSKTYSNIYAIYNWWGEYPPDAEYLYVDGTSTLDYSNALTTANGCPGGGGASAAPLTLESTSSSSPDNLSDANIDAQQTLKEAFIDNMSGDYSTALNLCRAILTDKDAISYYKEAIGILFNIFQATGDKSIVDDLQKFASTQGDLGTTASLLLTSIYASMGKTTEAQDLAMSLINANPNSEIEMRSLIRLASLSAFNPQLSSQSKSAVNELAGKYGNSIDKGLLAALGRVVPESISIQSGQQEEQTNETKTDTTLTYSLANYPNPFNPTTIIHYVLPKAGFVTLKIYDMLGREVETLVNENKAKGVYNVTFNASDLASGVYIYQLRSGNFVVNKKLLLMK